MTTTATQETRSGYDFSASVEALQREGITGLKSAFSREWAEAMREDMMTAFWSAIQRPGGAVGRGPRRWYVEIHPQDFSGFVDLVTHPWVAGMCEAVLGPDYQIVEIGFDVPFQGGEVPALASRLPLAARNLRRAPHHLACLQPHRRGRDGGYGAVRDRARHPVVRRQGVEA